MPKKKQKKINTNFLPSEHVSDASIKRGQRNAHRLKSMKELGKTLVKGTVENATNAGNLISSIADLDLAESLSNFVHGGKTYAKHNIDALKSIWGIITGRNHPEWYTKNGIPETNLNFSQPRGAIASPVDNQVLGIGCLIDQTIPMEYVSTSDDTPGSITHTYSTGVWMTAISRLYAQLSGSNASNTPFTAADLGKYVETTRALIMYYEYLRKVILTMNTFNSWDKGSPSGQLFTLGINDTDPNKITASRATAIDRLNLVARQMSTQLGIFPQMSVIDRAKWLIGNTFRDDSDVYKASLINFIPGRLLSVSADNTYKIQEVPKVGYPTADNEFVNYTIEDCLDYMEHWLAYVLRSNKYAAILGYLLKAYGDRAYLTLEATTADDKVATVYDEQLLMQFNNARPTDFIYTTDIINSATFRDTVSIKANRMLTFKDKVMEKQATIKPVEVYTAKDDVSGGEAMSLMQLSSAVLINSDLPSGSSGSAYTIVPTSVGTEVLRKGVTVVYYGGNAQQLSVQDAIVGYIDDIAENFSVYLYSLLAASHVKGMPMLYILNIEQIQSLDNTNPWFSVIGDVQIGAPLTRQSGEILHTVSSLSMYKSIDIEEQDNWNATIL